MTTTAASRTYDGILTVMTDPVEIRIRLAKSETPHLDGYAWFANSDRDDVRDIGTKLIAWGGMSYLRFSEEETWGCEDRSLRLRVYRGGIELYVGGRTAIVLDPDQAVDLGQRLVIWAGPAAHLHGEP